MITDVYVCRKHVVIIHRSFVLEHACTVLVGKVQGAFQDHPVESLLVDGMYMTGKNELGRISIPVAQYVQPGSVL